VTIYPALVEFCKEARPESFVRRFLTLAPHLVGRFVLAQPDVDRLPQ
jgi:hypothetical protein